MGLAYVAPIGLQNLFVINSALTHTRRRAILTALIVIFFDVTLALACFFGIEMCIRDRVNDVQGNPVIIGSVVIWRVANPTKAVFNIENYFDYLLSLIHI